MATAPLPAPPPPSVLGIRGWRELQPLLLLLLRQGGQQAGEGRVEGAVSPSSSTLSQPSALVPAGAAAAEQAACCLPRGGAQHWPGVRWAATLPPRPRGLPAPHPVLWGSETAWPPAPFPLQQEPSRSRGSYGVSGGSTRPAGLASGRLTICGAEWPVSSHRTKGSVYSPELASWPQGCQARHQVNTEHGKGCPADRVCREVLPVARWGGAACACVVS